MPDRAAVSAAGHLLQSAVERRVFPAAVAEVGSSSGASWRQAFGSLTFDEHAPPADVETIFDLASLTKPIATTTVILQLFDRGALRLDEPVSAVLPEWRGADREPATVQHLLEHAAGLSARLLDKPPHGRRAFEHEICTMPLEYPPGSRSIYSDLGFILLGFCAEQRGTGTLADQARVLLEAVAKAEPDADANGELLVEVPSDARHRTAPTTPLPDDERRGRRLIGEVHDNYAAALGGFAGHAGLFGTAPGIGRFARVVLRAARGEASLPGPLTASLVTRAIEKSPARGSSRASGWDTMLPTSSCGGRLSARAFGHVGFTGTSLWIDPVLNRYFVLLSNRACEGGSSEEMQQVRRAFHDALASP